MHILVMGVRHRTAPIEVRERFALLEEEVCPALECLKAMPGVLECAILTTCNRTEIYTVVRDTEMGHDAILRFYREFKGLDISQYARYRFMLMHGDAVMHLFQVASGMDSLILGEGQILGQVKDALATAHKVGTNGTVLNKLFKAAISAGKRVRTETGIAEKDVSVSRAAYELAQSLEPELLNRRIALVGGGKMAEIMLTALKRDMTPAQQANVLIVNRSKGRLETLVEKYGFAGVLWDELPRIIRESEVLFVATGAPHIVLGPEHFENAGSKLVLDISVPRNVNSSVGKLPGIRLYNTDNLADGAFALENQAELKRLAQAMLNEEAEAFQQWFISLPVVPVITQLHSKLEQLRKTELSQSMDENETNFAAVDELSRSLVRKILHDPTVRLKSTRTMEEIYQHAAALSHLFDIEPDFEPPYQSRRHQTAG